MKHKIVENAIAELKIICEFILVSVVWTIALILAYIAELIKLNEPEDDMNE